MIIMWFFTVFTYRLSADYPGAYQLWHQSPASVTAELIIDLHHHVMFYLILILVVVVILLYGALTTSK